MNNAVRQGEHFKCTPFHSDSGHTGVLRHPLILCSISGSAVRISLDPVIHELRPFLTIYGCPNSDTA
jgi:hypothetical protein